MERKVEGRERWMAINGWYLVGETSVEDGVN